MLAYTNTIHTKESAVALAQKHQDMDNFIQGSYLLDNGKGCSVGCMVGKYREEHGLNWHESTEPLFGIPRMLSRIQDRIFEGLPLEDAKKWTVRFISAVPEGKDLSNVIPKLMYWLMTDPEGIRKHARPDGLNGIELVASLYKRKLDGDTIADQEWLDARKVCRAAYAAADADSAAYAAAYAAYAAADADSAAYAAAYAAYAAARKQFYIRIADKLINILENE